MENSIRRSGFGASPRFLRGRSSIPPGTQFRQTSPRLGQSDDAIREADAVISSNDTPALAEAYYIRGYAIEIRPKADNAAAAHDFSMARESYSHGLTCNPRPAIAGRLHVQLGNVCYYQEDYSAAVPELTAAYNILDSSQPKDLILYHIGICEQRLGRFDDADRTFQRVQQEYPNCAYAAPAKAHQGIRGFYVQLGTYSQSRDIDNAARAVPPPAQRPENDRKRTDRHPHRRCTILRPGPTATRTPGSQYPDARVMP